MTLNEIIADEIRRETGGKKDGGYTNNPNDRGGRTQYGIAERSNPEAWADGKVDLDEAERIYEAKYVKGPGFDRIGNARLQAQLVDFGVTSGPGIAIQKIQGLVGAKVDGVLGPESLARIEASDQVRLNNQLALERLKMIGRIVSKNHTQAEMASGWINRAVDFFIT
jgi:lysozyme family protein